MLQIGEFAGVTGLTVKALRHYDSAGVLVPAGVAESSRYRRYGEEQVRHGVMIRALRDAGVPLPAVAAAFRSGAFNSALADHRRHILEQRMLEDQAFEAADAMLRALAAPASATVRTMAAQPYVGKALYLPVGENNSSTQEDAEQVCAELYLRLQELGLGPAGQFWTALRCDHQGTTEVWCCWPTVREVSEGYCGPGTFSATLPARTELAITWQSPEGAEPHERSLHPAVVCLFDAVAERGFVLGDVEIRQTTLSPHASNPAVEMSFTVSSSTR
ncbi:hypothetical protein KEM60_02767 [Austwickia sp. TVS 96-490-7B]|uniref:MerR family transcriptional regulator n=1 Tax=Austwickia sp. TVS 96-490-7B TaxID=2830843 RepID=UPI001C584E34|nr:MerR family transcriptional regulator [Austwickia sp. TVS 96-490-7B]MBW3086542.1 hypothetical protein [Austwickia sp. TVS 96-490-7B]